MEKTIFLIHLGVTLFLAGLIWTIQIVHYPLFTYVGEKNYQQYQSLHMSRITFLVMPVMLTELATAIYLAIFGLTGVDIKLFRLGLGVLLIIWLSTLFWQAPIHSRLTEKSDEKLIKGLVLSNWLRTILWTCRGILVLWIASLKME